LKIELENWKDALDLLGHDNPFANKGKPPALSIHSGFHTSSQNLSSRYTDFHHVPTTDGGIKVIKHHPVKIKSNGLNAERYYLVRGIDVLCTWSGTHETW
jgi:hypothetical protein